MELLYLLIGLLIGGTIGAGTMAVVTASSKARSPSNDRSAAAHPADLDHPAQMPW